MKILMITHVVPYPPHGGVRIRNFNLLREASRRHEIHLFTFSQKAHHETSGDLQASIDAIRRHCAHVEVFPISSDRSAWRWRTLLAANTLSATPYSVWRYRSRAMAEAIRGHLLQHTFDLVEIGEIGLAHFAHRVGGAPRLLVHHNVESELLRRRARYVGHGAVGAYMKYQAAKLRRFERRSAPWFARHTTCSEHDARLLARIAPHARVVVVPNGVDTEYFRPLDTEASAEHIVFAGALNWFPNLDAMLYLKREIWPCLKQEIPHLSASIIGKGASAELAREGQLDPEFRLLGFVDDIRPIISRSAVYVVPIRVGGGTRLKILDAMAMGKAVVSTSVGCEGLRVTHGKDILIADKPADFVAAVTRVMRNTELRRRLERNARRTVEEHYTWETIGRELERAYSECVQEARSRAQD